MRKKICLWSCPRNVSTALMYSFRERPDTLVFDEPLYAHYLSVSGAKHPGREDTLISQENDGEKVVEDIILGNYQKHCFFKLMTHFLINIDKEFLRLWFIDNCDNIRYVDNLKNQQNLTLDEREHLIYIMRTSNKVWKMRNKMLDGDWNLEDIKLDEMEKELRNLLPNNKIGAIKHYRQVMIDEFGKQVSLRDSKERIDNLSREMTYEQGLIINH